MLAEEVELSQARGITLLRGCLRAATLLASKTETTRKDGGEVKEEAGLKKRKRGRAGDRYNREATNGVTECGEATGTSRPTVACGWARWPRRAHVSVAERALEVGSGCPRKFQSAGKGTCQKSELEWMKRVEEGESDGG